MSAVFRMVPTTFTSPDVPQDRSFAEPPPLPKPKPKPKPWEAMPAHRRADAQQSLRDS
jgi:hypothetical protein